jgi:hypothetical protein
MILVEAAGPRMFVSVRGVFNFAGRIAVLHIPFEVAVSNIWIQGFPLDLDGQKPVFLSIAGALNS